MLLANKSLAGSTITAGGTSQQVQAATSRVFIGVYNNSDTIMYINFGEAASATVGIPIAAGGKWESGDVVPQNSINIICATTGKAFSYLIV